MNLVTTLLALATLGWGFNLNPQHAVVLDDPESDRESYFGYALGYWRQSNHGQNVTWLLVGAPQAQQEGLQGDRVRQPGAVFKCSLDDIDNPRCSKITILRKEDRQEQDLSWRRKKVNIPKRAWIGATITVENEPNGAVVVCAPRMKQMADKDTWTIPGMCFYWRSENEILPLAPLKTAYHFKSQNHRTNGFYVGMAQSGMSAHFVENSTSSQLVVGSPGVDFFTGAVNVYEQAHQFNKGLPSLHIPELPSNQDCYLGYSVTSARLHNDDKVSYIAGAPRDTGSDFLTGVVYIMTGAHQMKWSMETKLAGQQMGEYFGACVASLDLNFDGIDDFVLVGAPLHSQPQSSTVDTGEQGQLYVYKNMGQGRLDESPYNVLTGSSMPGARFASSVTAIGDLNRDGYNDIAVGAPYEGGGAVYIYLGGRHGFSIYSQRISASDISNDLSGFGFSFASGLDLDGNSFNDLAIGSYESGNVVIVKSQPIIEMEASLQPAVSNLDVNAKSVTIKACLGYTTNAHPNLLNYIDAKAVIKADLKMRRAVFESGGYVQETRIRLQRDQTQCWDIQVSLKGNLIQMMIPVEFSMKYRVVDDPDINRKKTFCKMCPVTDPLKASVVHIEIPFANGCGGKQVCLADLKVEAQSSNNGKAIVLGEDTKITVAVSVVNSKEPAYLAKLSLALPKSTRLMKMPKHCYQEEDGSLDNSEEEVVFCGLRNILASDHITKAITERRTVFEIDVSCVDFYTPLLSFNITTWSASEEQTPDDNSVMIEVPVILISEVEITGNTLQKHLTLSWKEETKPSVISVIHNYEVTNLGPSPVEEIKISSSVPFGLITDEKFGVMIFGEIINPQVTIRGHTVRCSVDYSSLNVASYQVSRYKRDTLALEANETEIYLAKNVFHLNCSESGAGKAACALLKCAAGPLSSGDTAELKLQLNINRTMIDLIQQKDIIQISSTSWIEVDEKYEIPSGNRMKLTNVATLLVGSFEEMVSPWLLLLATILGLFLLSILVQILSRIGFFRRKYKEDMETMRHASQDFAYQKFLPEFESNIFF